MKFYFDYKIGVCLLLFLISFTSTIKASHGATETNSVEIHDVVKKEKPQKKIIKRLFAKKSKKLSSNDKSISNGAIITLIVGVLALFCLFAPLLAAFGTGIWILAIILALVGDIFGIRTLRKIKKSDDPAKYSDEKIMTIVGFTMALLTGIIPLLLLGIVLLSL